MGVTCAPHGYHMHTTCVSHAHHMGADHYIRVVDVQTRTQVFAKDAVNEIGSICEKVWHMGVMGTPHGHHMYTTWVYM